MAEFKVDHCFGLESRNLFVLAGAIVEGQVGRGMKIGLGDGHEAQIAHLEFIDYADRRPEAEIAVCLHYASEEQLASFRALKLNGRTLSVG